MTKVGRQIDTQNKMFIAASPSRVGWAVQGLIKGYAQDLIVLQLVFLYNL